VIEFEAAEVEGRLQPTTLMLSEQRIAIVGANGSGKSTLARMVNGLVEPTAGAVRVRGLDTRSQGPKVRRTVGFVFTDPAAQLVMPTVLEDVSLSLRRKHPKSSERENAAREVLGRFALADFAERSVHQLSGGQQQLLAIASVLAADPEVVVADEPTTMLDLANTRRVWDVLMSLDQQLVVITHNLELAVDCERALLVADGSVVADGDPASVIEQYRRSV
jgi:biotin transport system ATP-binding protein